MAGIGRRSLLGNMEAVRLARSGRLWPGTLPNIWRLLPYSEEAQSLQGSVLIVVSYALGFCVNLVGFVTLVFPSPVPSQSD